MKKTTLIHYVSASLILCFGNGFAQEQPQQMAKEKCLTQVMYEEAIKLDPQYAINRQKLQEETERYAESLKNGTAKTNSAPKIIPVVVHVIHEDGAENITYAQIQDGIRVLNEDFRRLNADTTNTPAAFKGISADANIEFRLATKDPNGNCTDGVTRTFSHLTNNARNNVKSLIDWPNNKYLNIWLVKTIENTSGSSGFIIGFAQFPGGSAATDGVVCRHDYFGSTGTAVSSGYKGRTATHEVGHWLNLCHIWDCNTATCGTDNVNDTPKAQAANSGCPSFPHDANICTGTGANGEMYVNYMDYTDGSCQNAFSAGQSTVMNTALNSSTSGRNNLWTSANLTATGATVSPAPLCTPKAYFTSSTDFVCEGGTVTFTDKSWNGTPTSWNWTFPGGTPGTSTSQSPSVVYNSAGTYNVTLTSTNTTGSSTPLTKTGKITVYPDTGKYDANYSEGFEGSAYPNVDWLIFNDDAAGPAWAKVTTAKYSGTASLKLNNSSTTNKPGLKDYFISPTIDISKVTSPAVNFKLAFIQKTSTDADILRVAVSTNCGQSWTQRYTKSGATLATATPPAASAWTPSSTTQWRLETVNILPFVGAKALRLKFEFISDAGNNIYIDDINITGTPITSGMELTPESNGFTIHPNPAGKNALISLFLAAEENITVKIYDVMGKEVATITDQKLSAGEHHFNLNSISASGVYFAKLITDSGVVTKRFVYNPLF